MPKNKKPMTLDDLARLVAAGFQGVDKQLREIEEVMATKSDLEGLATKLELHDEVERLAAEIRKVQDAVTCDDSEHLHDLDDRTERRFEAIEKRLNRIEKRAQ